MGGSSKPSINTQLPDEFIDPDFKFGNKSLTGTGINLLGGGFMPGVNVNLPERYQGIPGSDLSFLYENVTMNPEITGQAIDLANRDVIRERDVAQQNILNQLEANNQLTSSVTGDALTDLNREFSSDIADIATTFRLADQQRALQTRLDLFNLGGQFTQSGAALGLENQSQRNSFALANFENQLAMDMANQENQRGGFAGALTGALGGGLAGFATGNPLAGFGGALAGGLAGGFGNQGMGSSIFSGGGSIFGASRNKGSVFNFGNQAPAGSAGSGGAGGFGIGSFSDLGTTGLTAEQVRRNTLSDLFAEQFSS